MIRCSDRPKTYWGYYQDYLVYISEKNNLKKMTLIFFKIRWPAIWTEKFCKTGVSGRCSNFGLKLNVQVQYNMFKANMARSYRLTCLKSEANNLLKLSLQCLTFEPFLRMIRCSERPKTYWGYYEDYLVYISEKKFKKNDLDFFQNSMTRDMNRKLGKTGVAGDVQILA